MKSVLENFLEESKGVETSAPTVASVKVGSTSQPIVSSGQLLLAGCNDWDNATAKTPNGLPTVHRVDLGSEVENVFSSSSSLHEFSLLADGSVRAMGKNDHGQLGTGDLLTRELPVCIELPSTSKVVKIATGRSHTLVLFESGEVWGCGACNFGQLGSGTSKTAAKDSLKFIKVPFTTPVRDIACGYDFSLACTRDGALYGFGHPEYGVLGQGTDGQYIKDGGKGAAVQYSCEYVPKRIVKFVTKDNHGKVTATIDGASIRIRAVAAGKNHALCLEDWEAAPGESEEADNLPLNRVFSWGWGGYGRLGHNAAQDEFFPREVLAFSHFLPAQGGAKIQVAPVNAQKKVREIVCGSSFSIAVTESRHLAYWGKMSNAPRGEATVYPQVQQELFDYPVRRVAAGSNLIVVIAGYNNRAKKINGAEAGPSVGIAWGAPTAGKIGFEGDARSSTNPKILSMYEGLNLMKVSCGYGHVSFVAVNEAPEDGSSQVAVDKLATLSVLSAVAAPAGGKGKAGGKKKAGEIEAKAPAAKKAKK